MQASRQSSKECVRQMYLPLWIFETANQAQRVTMLLQLKTHSRTCVGLEQQRQYDLGFKLTQFALCSQFSTFTKCHVTSLNHNQAKTVNRLKVTRATWCRGCILLADSYQTLICFDGFVQFSLFRSS